MITDQRRRLLISLKPRFASAILDGSKTVELRRTRPRIEVPTEALIYASAPSCGIVGTCKVVEVIEGTPSEIWRSHGSEAGVSRAEFVDYFVGSRVAYGLVIAEPAKLPTTLSLDSLRAVRIGFHPPQSFRYLSTEDSDDLLALAS